ncbi:MAG: DUF2868 domain-containing protein, partial [Planctomycetota bacterium]
DADLAAELRDVSGAGLRVARWFERAASSEAREARDRAAAAITLARAAVVLVGLGFGYASARVVFAYRGDAPINVVEALLVYAGLNALTLLLAAVAGAPASWRLRVPGLAAVSDALSTLSPGRFVGAAWRLAPAEPRRAGQSLLASSHAGARWSGDVARWCVLAWSQVMAVAFHIGALAGFLQLVVFRDLSFGWSTTLEVSHAGFEALVRWLSLPWAWAWPAAAPGLELVAESRFFRGQTPPDPQRVQPWWRFLLMAMLVYGLAPRVLAWIAAQWRLRLACAEAVTLLPGYAGLQARLRAGAHTTGTKPASIPENFSASGAAEPVEAPPALEPGMRWFVVNWADAPVRDDALAERLGLDVVGAARAGLGGLETDRAALRRAAEALRAAAPADGAVVLVKDWEPPTGEAVDFLRDLREALGPGVPVRLRLMPEPGGAAVDPALQDARSADWDRKLRELADPWIARQDADPEGGPS